ncbi:MAG: hypothetical protein IT444_10605 [Phycisphaeraceae bacterium]|nr:hypothetical protein [Phycisphaeraceae bacterium]
MRKGLSPFIAVLIALLSGHAAQAGPVTSGLELWLKSDTGVTTDINGRVSQWDDQAIAVVQNATQGTASQRPLLTTANIGILSNHPVLFFDGFGNPTQSNRDFLSFTLANANTYSGMTIFFVAQGTHDPLRSPENAAVQFVVASGGSSGSPSPGIRWAFGLGQLEPTAPAALGWAGSGGSPHLGTGVNLDANELYITSYVKTKGGGSGWSMEVNGAAVTSVADTTFPTGNFNGIIGAESTVLDYAFTGYIAEILIYNRALSATEVDNVYDYLDSRYFTPEPASAALLVLMTLSCSGRRTWRRLR